MAHISYPPAPAQPSTAVAVVSPRFIAPYSIDLTIVEKQLSLSDGTFSVTDVHGKVMFKLKGKHLSLNDRRILLDADGNPILSFQKKLISFHHRWLVFRGDSSESKDMIFSAKESCLIQFKTSLDVFMKDNESENMCDYKVKGSWFDRSCIIYASDGTAVYAGDGTTIIAKMHNKRTDESIAIGNDTFSVTVYPNVDYAFVVALVVILHEINEEKNDVE